MLPAVPAIRKLLIANRGEIAVRIIRSCRDLGVATVAVYSECDRDALHVRLADHALPIGGNLPRESYLRIEAIVDAARAAGADAVHPGYGFLAENADFAEACRAAGLIFVGPTARAMRAMGSKTAARQTARAAGVPVVPGTDEPIGPDTPEADVRAAADAIGFPLMLKAVAGGGGKGLRHVATPDELGGALRAARSEALSAFGDATVYLERRLLGPRHVEVQLLGDEHGTIVPFVERECSIQRRHQKVLEESPSAALDAGARAALLDAAARIARSVGYTNAGTIEFLLDADGRWYFLEMNTRLQVEHPITELVTGIDLVAWQLRIAQGAALTIDRDRVGIPMGHAIEARIYAEDPDSRFMPSPGRVTHLRPPSGPGVRDDSGLVAPGVVPIYYDALVSKLAAWGVDRPAAIARLTRALREYEIEGIRTTLPFFRWLVREPDFQAGRFDTTYLDTVLAERGTRPFWEADGSSSDLAAMAVAVQLWAREQQRHTQAPAGRPVLSSWTSRARAEGLQ